MTWGEQLEPVEVREAVGIGAAHVVGGGVVLGDGQPEAELVDAGQACETKYNRKQMCLPIGTYSLL